MAGAEVAIELSKRLHPTPQRRRIYFATSGRNLLAAEAAAGVRGHLALADNPG